MATVVMFNGRKCIEPGSYAAVVYNPTSVVNVAEFGNVMIIDTGLSQDANGFEFSGGAGINGTNAQGLKAVYQFDSISDFRNFTGGGKITDIVSQIFAPYAGQIGAPKVFYTRAASTIPAGAGIPDSSGQCTISFTCKNEGECGNAVFDNNNILKAGYTIELSANAISSADVKIMRGTYAGTDEYGEPYGAYSYEDAQPEVIFEMEAVDSIRTLYNALIKNRNIISLFVVELTGDESAYDNSIDTQTSIFNFSGGWTDYTSPDAYDNVLEAIEELDITFFLCCNLDCANGAAVDSATNGKLFTYIKNSAKFTEFMVVAGGRDDSDLFEPQDTNVSEGVAQYYNSSQVVVVHGSPVVMRRDGVGTKNLDPIYLAATVIGLNAGLSPQTPITFKRIGYSAFVYDLKKKEREKALQLGILHMRNINGYYCVNQGITTLQNNLQTIAPDGQSFELSIELIKAQLNKELIIESDSRFIGNTAAQASPESVKNFAETKLASFVASPGNDNLIITWRNVNVKAKNGDYTVYYDFVPNVPVNKTFFVGNMLDFEF